MPGIPERTEATINSRYTVLILRGGMVALKWRGYVKIQSTARAQRSIHRVCLHKLWNSVMEFAREQDHNSMTVNLDQSDCLKVS